MSGAFAVSRREVVVSDGNPLEKAEDLLAEGRTGEAAALLGSLIAEGKSVV